MPLIRTPGEPEHDKTYNMIGFWMREPGALGPIDGVRVFITLAALWNLGRCKMCDVASALEVFARQRGSVETAAGRQFDDPSGRTERDELYDGRPVVVVTTDDLLNLPKVKNHGPQPFLT